MFHSLSFCTSKIGLQKWASMGLYSWRNGLVYQMGLCGGLRGVWILLHVWATEVSLLSVDHSRSEDESHGNALGHCNRLLRGWTRKRHLDDKIHERMKEYQALSILWTFLECGMDSVWPFAPYRFALHRHALGKQTEVFWYNKPNGWKEHVLPDLLWEKGVCIFAAFKYFSRVAGIEIYWVLWRLLCSRTGRCKKTDSTCTGGPCFHDTQDISELFRAVRVPLKYWTQRFQNPTSYICNHLHTSLLLCLGWMQAGPKRIRPTTREELRQGKFDANGSDFHQREALAFGQVENWRFARRACSG